MATTKLMTAEDLAQLPDDDNRYDLIEGVLHTMSPAGGGHGAIAFVLGLRLGNFAEPRRLGTFYTAETGFLLARDPDTVLAPDLAFLRTDRVPPRDQMRGFVPVSPDFVLEVRSPSDRLSEIMKKIDVYLAAGVAQVWYVDPDKQELTILRPGQPPHSLNQNDVLDGGDIFPGFTLPLREIFSED